jgi:hypothetical protein
MILDWEVELDLERERRGEVDIRVVSKLGFACRFQAKGRL